MKTKPARRLDTYDVTADLSATLLRLAQEQGIAYRVEQDNTAPQPWAVWADDDEILGAGDSLDEALEDAVNQLRSWEQS